MNKSWRFSFISKFSPPKLSLLGLVALFCLFSGTASAVDGANPRVMVSGDSISAGFNQPSYRMHFYNSLIADNCTVDMVGDQDITSYNIINGNAGIDYPNLFNVVDGYPSGSHWSKDNANDDTDHQAFGGLRADQILNGQSYGGGSRVVLPISDYAATYAPDFVLLHLGTNDLGQKLKGGNPPTSTSAINTWANQTRNDMRGIISALKAQNSSVKILVGNFIPRRGEFGNSTKIGGVATSTLEVQMGNAYRASLTAEINGMNDSNVQLVDVKKGFNHLTMTYDGIHPNRAGEIKIANAFAAKFKAMGGCNGSGGGGGGSEPEILNPADGSTINGSSVNLTWTDNDIDGVDRWWVRAGMSSSGVHNKENDYYNSGNIRIPSATSLTVPNLPQDGSTVYISLWYYSSGEWTMADINQYTSADNGGGGGGGDQPEITSPAEPGPIDGTSVGITWDSNGVSVNRWWVRAGRNSDGSANSSDYYNSGNIFNSAAASRNVSNLPADGSTVYISLWYYAGGVWSLGDVKSYVNTGDNGGGGGGGDTPEITSPTSSSIDGDSVNVTWDSNGFPGIVRWWVRVGSDSTGTYDETNDYHNSGTIFDASTDSWIVDGLPEDGSTVYISLWYYANSTWTQADIQSYVNNDDGSGGGGGGSTTPEITSPLPPASINGTQVTVTWDSNGFPGVSRWWVRAGIDRFGSDDAANDYHNSGVINKSLSSYTVSDLPADSSTVYISLWYLLDGQWLRASIHSYTNFPEGGGGGSSPPSMVSPLAPAVINGNSVNVSWNRNGTPGITRWWVRAGKDASAAYSAAEDYYNSGSIHNNAATSQLVTGLPSDGSTVYISVWYFIDGDWFLAQVEGLVNQ